MGYSTSFTGQFNLDKPLSPEHLAYLLAFSETRRVCRNADVAESLPDELRAAAELPIGNDGAYFVGKNANDTRDESITDYNSPPRGQPGLWCNWIPTDDGENIVWNGMEKFYDYEEWLAYLCTNFFARWGYKLNGRVEWQGDDPDDKGVLVVEDNKTKAKYSKKNKK